MKKLISLILIFGLIGCAHLLPASKIALDAAQATSAVFQLKSNYVSVRDSVRSNKTLFTESELQTLVNGNKLIESVAHKVDTLKSNGSATTLLVTNSEIVQIAIPVRTAVGQMIQVMDAHLSDMDAVARYNYVVASRNYSLVDGYVSRILDEPDNQAKARMMVEVLKIAAQIAGVAQIAFTK